MYAVVRKNWLNASQNHSIHSCTTLHYTTCNVNKITSIQFCYNALILKIYVQSYVPQEFAADVAYCCFTERCHGEAVQCILCMSWQCIVPAIQHAKHRLQVTKNINKEQQLHTLLCTAHQKSYQTCVQLFASTVLSKSSCTFNYQTTE